MRRGILQIQQEYQQFLAQVNKLTDRRQAVTSIYLSITSAIVGAITFVFKDVQMINWGKQLSLLMLMLAGIIICDLWRRLIKQYSTLIEWWYSKLRNLEEKIPECSKLLSQEYQELYAAKHKGISRYEIRLTWIFTIIYTIFGLMIIGTLLFV